MEVNPLEPFMTSERIKQVIRDEETKRVIKEAIREWLDEKFAAFGKWTLAGFLSLVTVALLYLVLWQNGWHKS